MRLKISISLLACMCIVGIQGFLLDDRTTPASSSNLGLSRQHYDTIMGVIYSEREARKQLEKSVKILEQELQATEKGVTVLYHLNQAYNQTISDQNNKINSLMAENSVLKRNSDLLKADVDGLKNNNTQIQSDMVSMQQQVVALQQLKGISDLQAVLDLQNKTNHLDGELIATNTKVNSMAVDIEARKQDFMALYSQASATEKHLEQAEAILNTTLASTIQHQNQTLTDITDTIFQLSKQQNATAGKVDAELRILSGRVSSTIQQQNQTMTDINDKLIRMSKQQNVTAGRVESELRTMSGRAVITSCATDKTYSGNDKILFPYVQTKSSVSDTIVDNFGKTGIFKVEKSGLYFISVYIMTNTVGRDVEFHLYKNGSVVGYGNIEVTNLYQTSTVVLTEHLSINDTLYIRVNNGHVWGGTYSCITLLQLTEDM